MAEGVYPNGMPHPPASLRLRMAIELGVLVLLTTVFLLFAPRDTTLFIGMALIAMGMIGFTAAETRERIWGPPDSPDFDRVRRCAVNMTALTVPPVVVFFVYALIFQPQRALNPNFPIALLVYVPWALLQQTIFQFYLLGRLRALLPFASPMLLSMLNGIAYGLVHLPDIPVTVVTIIGGVFWSYSYYRDRYVLPIAISHALLGSSFYYWIYGKDLIAEQIAKW